MGLFKARQPEPPLILDADIQADLDEYAQMLGHLARLIYDRVNSSPILTKHLLRVMARLMPAIVMQRGDKIEKILETDPFAQTVKASIERGWENGN
jgi:hypothetical protein